MLNSSFSIARGHMKGMRTVAGSSAFNVIDFFSTAPQKGGTYFLFGTRPVRASLECERCYFGSPYYGRYGRLILVIGGGFFQFAGRRCGRRVRFPSRTLTLTVRTVSRGSGEATRKVDLCRELVRASVQCLGGGARRRGRAFSRVATSGSCPSVVNSRCYCEWEERVLNGWGTSEVDRSVFLR